MLKAPFTDLSIVYTVPVELKRMMEVIGQQHSVITFHQAIYRVAKEIQWNRPEEFENTVIRLGGFHMLTNYMGALGTMTTSGGLAQLLIHSNVYAEKRVNQILNRKRYNWGFRTHKLLSEATRWKLANVARVTTESSQIHRYDPKTCPILYDSLPESDNMLVSCRCKKPGCKQDRCKCKCLGLDCTDLRECQECENNKRNDLNTGNECDDSADINSE